MNAPHSVLIVDDEADISEVLADICQTSGRSFRFAENGQVALDILHKETIDLVVCDFTMPVMDGITFFERTRALGHRMPFIFLSGNYDNSLAGEKFALQGVYIFGKTQFVPLKEKLNALTAAKFPAADSTAIGSMVEQLRQIHRGH